MFGDIFAARFQVAYDSPERTRGIVKAGRKLKKKASHTGTNQICNKAKIADQSLSANKSLRMRDEFGRFNRVRHLRSTRLANPGFHIRNCGP